MEKKLLLVTLILIANFIKAQPCPSITGFNIGQPSCFGLCNGSIEISYTAGTPPYTIVWSSPISQTIVTSALTQSVSGICPGFYSATVSDNNSCVTSQPVNVSQPALLSLLVTPNTTICYGSTTQIAASGQGGTPPYTYSWSPTSFIGGGPHTVNPISTSVYTVSVNDANGCAPSPKTIIVNVTQPLNIVANSINICDGDAVTLSPIFTSQGNGGPYNYFWSTSSSSNSITIIGNAPSGATTNTYAVSVDDGCTIPSASATFTVNANVCTGINELNNLYFSIYPNPTNASLTINANDIVQKIEITNVAGQLLFSESVTDKNCQIQLQNFGEGIYFVKVIYNIGMSVTKKFVKN